MSSTRSNREGLQTKILQELKSMEDMLKQVYEEMVILHKVMIPLYEIKNGCQKNLRILKLAHTTIDMIQEWSVGYLDAPASFARKGRIEDEIDKLEMKMNIQAYDQLNNHIANNMLAYM